jgi:hypothetical protein
MDRRPLNRHGRACPDLATDGRDMPGHDDGTICRWHFHPVAVDRGSLCGAHVQSQLGAGESALRPEICSLTVLSVALLVARYPLRQRTI